MRFAVYQGEHDIASLVSRVYQLRRPSPAILTKAEEALIEANPHLRKLPQQPGVLIVVPELEKVQPTDDTAGSRAPGDMGERVHEALAVTREVLIGAADRQREQAKTTLELLERAELNELARRDRTLVKRLATVARTATLAVERADARLVEQEEALATLSRDLDQLVSPKTRPNR